MKYSDNKEPHLLEVSTGGVESKEKFPDLERRREIARFFILQIKSLAVLHNKGKKAYINDFEGKNERTLIWAIVERTIHSSVEFKSLIDHPDKNLLEPWIHDLINFALRSFDDYFHVSDDHPPEFDGFRYGDLMKDLLPRMIGFCKSSPKHASETQIDGAATGVVDDGPTKIAVRPVLHQPEGEPGPDETVISMGGDASDVTPLPLRDFLLEKNLPGGLGDELRDETTLFYIKDLLGGEDSDKSLQPFAPSDVGSVRLEGGFSASALTEAPKKVVVALQRLIELAWVSGDWSLKKIIEGGLTIEEIAFIISDDIADPNLNGPLKQGLTHLIYKKATDLTLKYNEDELGQNMHIEEARKKVLADHKKRLELVSGHYGNIEDAKKDIIALTEIEIEKLLRPYIDRAFAALTKGMTKYDLIAGGIDAYQVAKRFATLLFDEGRHHNGAVETLNATPKGQEALHYVQWAGIEKVAKIFQTTIDFNDVVYRIDASQCVVTLYSLGGNAPDNKVSATLMPFIELLESLPTHIESSRIKRAHVNEILTENFASCREKLDGMPEADFSLFEGGKSEILAFVDGQKQILDLMMNVEPNRLPTRDGRNILTTAPALPKVKTITGTHDEPTLVSVVAPRTAQPMVTAGTGEVALPAIRPRLAEKSAQAVADSPRRPPSIGSRRVLLAGTAAVVIAGLGAIIRSDMLVALGLSPVSPHPSALVPPTPSMPSSVSKSTMVEAATSLKTGKVDKLTPNQKSLKAYEAKLERDIDNLKGDVDKKGLKERMRRVFHKYLKGDAKEIFEKAMEKDTSPEAVGTFMANELGVMYEPYFKQFGITKEQFDRLGARE